MGNGCSRSKSLPISEGRTLDTQTGNAAHNEDRNPSPMPIPPRQIRRKGSTISRTSRSLATIREQLSRSSSRGWSSPGPERFKHPQETTKSLVSTETANARKAEGPKSAADFGALLLKNLPVFTGWQSQRFRPTLLPPPADSRCASASPR